MRTMRFLCWLALPAALVLGGISMATARALAEGSAEARQACTPDAMRLCSEFIPDAAKVKACMLRKRALLSRACQVAMHGGPRRREYRPRHGVRVHHYYHHYHHR